MKVGKALAPPTPPKTDEEFFAEPRHSIIADKRQAGRMPTVNHEKFATIVAWDPRLALDIVLAGAEKATEVFERYRIDHAAAVELLTNPVFLKQLERYKEEIETSGMTFRMKARVLAEDVLPHGYELATDPTTPAAVRADMIQWLAKIADLEPKKDQVQAAGGGFSLQIVYAGNASSILVGEARAVAAQTLPAPIDHQP